MKFLFGEDRTMSKNIAILFETINEFIEITEILCTFLKMFFLEVYFAEIIASEALFTCWFFISQFHEALCYLSKWISLCNFVQVMILKTLIFENWKFSLKRKFISFSMNECLFYSFTADICDARSIPVLT